MLNGLDSPFAGCRRLQAVSPTSTREPQVSLAPLAAADIDYTVGVVLGRLLIPLVGVVLIVLGLRRRRNPSIDSQGTVLIVVGAVVLVLGVFGALAATANAGGT